MGARQDKTPISAAQKERFLERLAAGDSIVTAAGDEALRRKLYRLRDADEDFASDWKRAYQEGTDALVHEARRRAVEGVEDVKMIGKGDAQREVTFRTYSDQLLMFLIKQRDASFRERVAVEGAGDGAPPVQVEVKHSVDDLARVASILADAGALSPRAGADS
jgi:hypothetical protein